MSANIIDFSAFLNKSDTSQEENESEIEIESPKDIRQIANLAAGLSDYIMENNCTNEQLDNMIARACRSWTESQRKDLIVIAEVMTNHAINVLRDAKEIFEIKISDNLYHVESILGSYRNKQ
ncbi:hypothetical protein [Methylobacterium aquaticum]|uniref:hypothetical protein n=1 Tax=Methylobacterium aquaticum TaxID=270351 RepID=UPI0019342BD3|nr:hypothetical protein [Methylobacterium aquaticum]QRE74213.1 hypothetical protein F1D61_11885 [Methylobacterium aquaticum]